MPVVILKKGREKSLLRHHPWVFSGSVADISGKPEAGETVRIHSHEDKFLAWGAYSPKSKFIARVWSWNEDEVVNADFFNKKLSQSINARNEILSHHLTDAVRLVYAESDGIPGLIIDKYGDVIVLQSLSYGVEYWLDDIADLVINLTGAKWLYERSDSMIRQFEGLDLRNGVLREKFQEQGNEIPRFITIEENKIKFLVDVQNGQKTGFFLDQRRNRQVLSRLTDNRQVLDCFSYTGGFTMHAVAGGANSVTSIDESSEALDLLQKNLSLNNIPHNRVTCIKGDVFQELRRFRDENQHFDVVILDPPKFAPTASSQQRAARGYKDINLLAMKLLRRGGLLITFSCSGGISSELFQKIIAGAAVDANRKVKIVERLFQGSDHPVVLNYPEGNYLKGFVLKVE